MEFWLCNHWFTKATYYFLNPACCCLCAHYRNVTAIFLMCCTQLWVYAQNHIIPERPEFTQQGFYNFTHLPNAVSTEFKFSSSIQHVSKQKVKKMTQFPLNFWWITGSFFQNSYHWCWNGLVSHFLSSANMLSYKKHKS